MQDAQRTEVAIFAMYEQEGEGRSNEANQASEVTQASGINTTVSRTAQSENHRMDAILL